MSLDERPTTEARGSCGYTFDPTKTTDAGLQATWECPHAAHGESEFCPFHMSEDERRANGVAAEDVVGLLKRNLTSEDARMNEYVGADLPHLTLTYEDINGETNHVLNLQHAEIEGIDLSHARLDQGLNLQEATVGVFRAEDAVVTGTVDADELTVTDLFCLHESAFHEEVHLADAEFGGEVDCDEARFDEDTDFSGATFRGPVHFRNVTTAGTSHRLDDHVTFAGAEFHDETGFRQADFEYATFADATFRAGADFEHAAFDGEARFRGVEFGAEATFDETDFDDDAGFAETRFRGPVTFRGAEFRGGSRTASDDVTFEGATFGDDADFKLARFRFAEFTDATVAGDLILDRATFTARADCHRIEVEGTLDWHRVSFESRALFQNGTFGGEVDARESTFDGDAEFVGSEFAGEARFGEARFRGDASFRGSTFHGIADFRGAVFEGAAKHLDENASFEGVTFRGPAEFEAAEFTDVNFRDARFHGRCNLRHAVVSEGARFRTLTGSRETYVDMTDATIGGGEIVQIGDGVVPYDLTRATVGDLRLESEGDDADLLDSFRFCLTDFDAFDFSNHHGSLERNDWIIHTFVGNGATGDAAVEMTPEVIEETYRKAQDSADAVGDTPASREFEFKRYFYNRRKNWGLVTSEYSLNTWSRGKKLGSVGLNYVMQVTCGYGNRLPRIAAFTFLLPLLFGALYVLGGPLETGAGVIWNAAEPGRVLFEGIYYSYISFSTIGYGNIGPQGWLARILAASQGMLNGLFFTLLTFTLFKRVLGGS